MQGMGGNQAVSQNVYDFKLFYISLQINTFLW